MWDHALSQGNRRAAVILTAGDYAAFVMALVVARIRLSVDVLGYCLMPNHFLLVLRPKPDGDLGGPQGGEIRCRFYSGRIGGDTVCKSFRKNGLRRNVSRLTSALGWPTAPPLHGSALITLQPLLERLITHHPVRTAGSAAPLGPPGSETHANAVGGCRRLRPIPGGCRRGSAAQGLRRVKLCFWFLETIAALPGGWDLAHGGLAGDSSIYRGGLAVVGGIGQGRVDLYEGGTQGGVLLSDAHPAYFGPEFTLPTPPSQGGGKIAIAYVVISCS